MADVKQSSAVKISLQLFWTLESLQPSAKEFGYKSNPEFENQQ